VAAVRTPGPWLLAIGGVGWIVLAWLALDMSHPVAQLTMPATQHWGIANLVAVTAMWGIMMAAMMLPSALPVVGTFAVLCARNGEPARWRSFVTAYMFVWLLFSLVATGAQWMLQALGWVDPMIVSTSVSLNATLLMVAGIYQFTPIKHACLAHCRSPLAFLLGEWRVGMCGGLVMGLRHGLFCLGCCWALMALLFIGGVMNLAWVAALSILVMMEKLVPQGQRIAQFLGFVLFLAGAARIVLLAI
jgi:predicted metal-binding membrane protein